jgi:hypothetical protein
MSHLGGWAERHLVSGRPAPVRVERRTERRSDQGHLTITSEMTLMYEVTA